MTNLPNPQVINTSTLNHAPKAVPLIKTFSIDSSPGSPASIRRRNTTCLTYCPTSPTRSHNLKKPGASNRIVVDECDIDFPSDETDLQTNSTGSPYPKKSAAHRAAFRNRSGALNRRSLFKGAPISRFTTGTGDEESGSSDERARHLRPERFLRFKRVKVTSHTNVETEKTKEDVSPSLVAICSTTL